MQQLQQGQSLPEQQQQHTITRFSDGDPSSPPPTRPTAQPDRKPDCASTPPLFKQIYCSTFPQYGIVFYLTFSTVAKLTFGLSLNTLVKKPIMVAPIACGYTLYHYAYVLYPILHEKVAGCFK